jgi:hypothetical protein
MIAHNPLHGSGQAANRGLKESSGSGGGGFRQNKARSLLVISEISLALLLLVGAGLFIRTLIALRSVAPGFDPHNLVTTRTPLDPKFVQGSGIDQTARDVLQRLSVMPGVESAAFTRLLPLDGDFNSLPITKLGLSTCSSEAAPASVTWASLARDFPKFIASADFHSQCRHVKRILD